MRYGYNRRRRQRRQGYNNSNDQVLFAEFKFYNKEKDIINENKLLEIERQLVKRKKKVIFWSNRMFAKHGIGFKFYTELHEDARIDIYVKIIDFGEVSFNVKEFCDCKCLLNNKTMLGFEPTYKQFNLIDKITNSDTGLKRGKTIHTWDELVDILIVKKAFNRYHNEYNSTPTEFYKDVTSYFGDEYVPKINVDGQIKNKKVKYEILSRNYKDSAVYHIINVIEKRINNINYRIALIADPKYNDNINYRLLVFEEDSPYYVYIDDDRLFFPANNGYYFFDIDLKEFRNDRLVINRPLVGVMKDNINQILSEKEVVITQTIYRFYSDRVTNFADRDTRSYLDERQIKIIEQYNKLLDAGKRIKINDVIIEKNKIEILGERFKIEFEDNFFKLKDDFAKIKELLTSDIKYNFNILYEKIIGLSKLKIVNPDWTKESEYKEFERTEFVLNDMPIAVSKDGNRVKINGIFCRVADVFHILSRAICFRKVEEYNKYVKDVSFIGVDWKLMISNGMVLELNNPFYAIFEKTGNTMYEKVYMRFSLLWDVDRRQQVYLILNNKKYPIKYKGKFKRYFNFPKISLNMKELYTKLNECIEGLNDELVIDIVQNGIEEAKIVKARGEQLVQDTIKLVKAKEVTIEVRGGTNLFGYEFLGISSKSRYFVQKSDLTVFRHTDGTWNRRCIVDDTRKARIFEDKLANRLINIYNEPKKLKSYLGVK